MSSTKFHQVDWQEVAKSVKKVNPEIYKIISDLNLGPEYRLYTGEYPFGANILKRGKFQVPMDNQESEPIYSPEVPKKIRDDLIYNDETNPVGLILQNSTEISMTPHHSTTPVSLWFLPQGSMMGISRILSERPQQPPFIWDMTSGAHSLFMLPKISQTRKHKRLCSELGIQTDIPKSSSDHWQLFTDIANCGQFEPWTCKILYFSKKWFEKLDDPAWIHFKCYLLERFQRTFDYMGNVYLWDMLLNYILNKRKLRPDLYINNTAKHLFQIGTGFIPGLAPATSDIAGPIKLLQKVFLEIYDVKDQIPTILCPSYYDPYEPCKPVYYSINNPNLLETPKKRDNSSVISDLYDVHSLLKKYTMDIREDDYNIINTAFHRLMLNTEIKAFHPNPERYTPLYGVDEIIPQDDRFKICLSETENDEIAYHSTFFKGCFQLSPSEK